MNSTLDNEPVTAETLEANRRWDAEKGKHTVTMDPFVPLRARQFSNVVGGLLTDKKIQAYEEAGYYSESYREARKALMDRKKKKRVHREGNFLVYPDGRKIYSPE